MGQSQFGAPLGTFAPIAQPTGYMGPATLRHPCTPLAIALACADISKIISLFSVKILDAHEWFGCSQIPFFDLTYRLAGGIRYAHTAVHARPCDWRILDLGLVRGGLLRCVEPWRRERLGERVGGEHELRFDR
jgi:hypothetical protein